MVGNTFWVVFHVEEDCFDSESLFSSVCFLFLAGGSMLSVSSKGVCSFIRSRDFLNSGVRV